MNVEMEMPESRILSILRTGDLLRFVFKPVGWRRLSFHIEGAAAEEHGNALLSDRLQLFTEPYTRREMQELPNYFALARLLTPRGPVRPLIMKTMKY